MKKEKPNRWQKVLNALSDRRTKSIASIGRAAINIGFAIKRKDPILSGMAVFSTMEAISEMAGQAVNPWIKLRQKGYRASFYGMEKFIWNTLQYLEYNPIVLSEYSSGGSKTSLIEIELESNIKICWRFSNGQIYDCHAVDEGKAAIAFAESVRRGFGDLALLSTEIVGWETHLRLENHTLPMVNKFVSSIKEQQLIERINRFRDRKISRSALIVGPPGSGKTTLAYRIAKKLNGNLIVIDASALAHICGGKLKVESILSTLAPTVLLLDDFDRLCADNIQTLLGLIERIHRNVPEMLIISTVNDLDSVPIALRRPERHDEIVIIEPLNLEERRQIIKNYCEEFGTRLADQYVAVLAEKTEGFTGAYLKELSKRATIEPFELLEAWTELVKKLTNKNKKDEPNEKVINEGKYQIDEGSVTPSI